MTTFESLTSSKSNEWYTPEYIIEAVRELMGDIDLDPASHPIPQKWIKAKNFYTDHEDGFSKSWHGRVWLNPPYGVASKAKRNYGASVWLDKAWNEYQKGNMLEAVILARGDSTGLKKLLCNFTFILCDRIKFLSGDGSVKKSPVPGSYLIYLGGQENKFFDIFQKFGIWVTPKRPE